MQLLIIGESCIKVITEIYSFSTVPSDIPELALRKSELHIGNGGDGGIPGGGEEGGGGRLGGILGGNSGGGDGRGNEGDVGGKFNNSHVSIRLTGVIGS